MVIPFKRCSPFVGASTWMDHLSNFRCFCWRPLPARWSRSFPASPSAWSQPRSGSTSSSIWLYILNPLQTATLIIAFGLIVQGYSIWKLRRALDWKKRWPFVVGAALGVPVGVTIPGCATLR
jgi:hypothetical protein